MAGEFQAGCRWPEALPEASLAFACRGRELLLARAGEGWRVPALQEVSAAGLEAPRCQFLGRLGKVPAVSLEMPETAEPPIGMALVGLRAAFGMLGEEHFRLAALAVQIVDWDRDHQFCSRCGALTRSRREERAKACGSCGLLQYPRLAPAVIVLVHRGRELLLARSAHFPAAMFSTLAGFVEPGETLEETVHREIAEEVGLEVSNLRYFGSQPWPFPHSLMVGFFAEYAGGEILLEDPEIEEAAFFRPDRLPKIPPRISIARALIDHFLAGRL